jgi:hypothetical protein
VGDRYNQVYDPEKSWIRDDECCVHLGYRIRNSDAMVVARLAFDPVANQNAKRIVVDTIAASGAGRELSLACLPPFRAITRLSVRGKYIDDRQRLLVYEILRCTAPFPAAVVRADRPRRELKASAPMSWATKGAASRVEAATVDDSKDPTNDVLPEEADIAATPISAARLAEPAEGEVLGAASFAKIDLGADFATGEQQPNGPALIDITPCESNDELFALDGKRASALTRDRQELIGVLRIQQGPGPRILVEKSDGEVVPLDLQALCVLQILDRDASSEAR